MGLIGGTGTAVGPAIGAAFVVGLNHYLARTGEWVPFLIGATFVACVLTFRRGVVGELLAFHRRRTTRDRAAAPRARARDVQLGSEGIT